MRILVIEDNPIIVGSLSRLLGDEIDMVFATTHREAENWLDKAKAGGEHFNIILMDGRLDNNLTSLDLIPLALEIKSVPRIVAMSLDEELRREQARVGGGRIEECHKGDIFGLLLDSMC